MVHNLQFNPEFLCNFLVILTLPIVILPNLYQWIIVVVVLTVFATVTVNNKKITIAGAAGGWIMGLILYISAGITGLLLLTAFFVMGTLATSFGFKKKQQFKLVLE